MIATETTSKFSADGIVRFEPATHTYWKGDKQLSGVTSFISNYKSKPFIPEVEAEKYAIKHGGTKEQVLQKWKDNAQDGTNVHKIFEDYIETGAISCNTAKEIQAVRFIIELFRTSRLIPVAAEVLVYGNHLASMIDCIAKDKQGRHYILDWKTSKEISRNNYGKYMKLPFNEIECSTFTHYSLQVSIYKQLLKEFDIFKSYIVHIGSEGYELIEASYIETPEELL